MTPKSHIKVPVDVNDKFGGFVLTTSKSLQDQYTTLFPEASTLKGKVNYQCDLDPISNAGCAKCIYNRQTMNLCASKGQCDYINAYSDAMKNNFSVLNYSMFLCLPSTFRNKQLLVCDEASELEDILVSNFSINIKYKSLDFFKIPYNKLTRTDSESGYLWMCELAETLRGEMPSQNALSRANVAKHILDKANTIRELLERSKLLINFWKESEFIVEPTSEGVKISPLKVNRLANIVFRGVDKVLLMSATIINHSKMAESLGIGKDEYKFVDVNSTFNPKKSPIYTAPAKFDMRHKYINASMPKMVDSVLELCEIHKEDNGVIHTYNFKITKALQEATKGDPRFLFRDKFSTNEDILRKHFETPTPTVLVSPSLAFGTSLDNEHGRFQIITKLPYLPMGDKRIKTLADRDFNWYDMKMWIQLIQMCGRCTRSKTDHSHTYIFDKSFLSAIKRSHHSLPEWFKDRLV